MLEIYGNSCFYHVLLLCHLGRKYLFTYLLQIILQMQSYETLFCLQNNISKQHLPKVPKWLIRRVSNNSAHVFCKKLLAEENSCCCVSITRLVKSHLLLTYRGAFLWRNLGEICHFLTETFFLACNWRFWQKYTMGTSQSNVEKARPLDRSNKRKARTTDFMSPKKKWW